MNYNEFAYIYDTLMSDVDYEKWVDYLELIFKRYNAKPKLILELACGTGNITTRLAERNYDMIALDKSLDMLAVAQQKSLLTDKNILYINQDMTDFELYGTVDCIICMVDGINYITNKKSLLEMFKLVRNYLNPGGIFIFDIRSEYALSDIIGNNTFIEDTPNITYIWQNEFSHKQGISEMNLTFFVNQDGLYKKFEESHKLKCYSVDDIKGLLSASKLNIVGIFDTLNFEEPHKETARIFFVSRK